MWLEWFSTRGVGLRPDDRPGAGIAMCRTPMEVQYALASAL